MIYNSPEISKIRGLFVLPEVQTKFKLSHSCFKQTNLSQNEKSSIIFTVKSIPVNWKLKHRPASYTVKEWRLFLYYITTHHFEALKSFLSLWRNRLFVRDDICCFVIVEIKFKLFKFVTQANFDLLLEMWKFFFFEKNILGWILC